MQSVAGYNIIEKLRETRIALVYRAETEPGGRRTILKVLKSNKITSELLIRFRQEYELLRDYNFQGAPRVFELDTRGAVVYMAMEDFSGEPLEKIYPARCQSLSEFLRIALALCSALEELHRAGVIHKEINPSTVAWDREAGALKIFDFGMVTPYSRENPTLLNLRDFESDLPYISPEQTGRMNRVLDYRTDLYSLGALLYRLLAGTPPFPGHEPIELVHAHLALIPESPTELDNQIPEILSHIILKLLEKSAGDRYQSFSGLSNDLEECRRRLDELGILTPFSIATHDQVNRFEVPGKVYGREEDLAALLESFRKVSEGGIELALIEGPPGMGKTTLVNEIHKPVINKRGHFVSGKFDPYEPGSVYSTLVGTFRDLISQVLMESEKEVAVWRDRLLDALGPNAGIIVELIPETELLIGTQAPPPRLSPIDSQNRFELVLRRFLKTFARPEHPLVIFLDDLQWADPSSLSLIKTLYTDLDARYLFIILAFRDNAADRSRPLGQVLWEISEQGFGWQTIRPRSLDLSEISRMIGETLKVEPKETLALSDKIGGHTEGNPLLIKTYLEALYSEGYIRHNGKSGWSWDLSAIGEILLRESPLELNVGRINRLPIQARNLILTASCIGTSFQPRLLARICDIPTETVMRDLESAVNEGLLIFEESQFAFTHNRVHEAAYSLLDDQTRTANHYKTGLLLLELADKDLRGERLFTILGQLNMGASLIRGVDERYHYAELNLRAGQKAKNSIAYETALVHYRIGIEYLPEEAWADRYELCFELHLERAVAEYLNANYGRSERIFDMMLGRARSMVDRANIYEERILLYHGTGKTSLAIQVGLRALRILGTNPLRGKFFNRIRLKFAFNRMHKFKVEDILGDADRTDSVTLSSMRILMVLTGVAYTARPELLPVFFARLTFLAMRGGNSGLSAFGYMAMGVLDINYNNKSETAYTLGSAALQLADKFAAEEIKGRLNYLFACFISVYHKSTEEALFFFRKGYRFSQQTGDLEFMAYNANHICIQSLLASRSLGEVLQEFERYKRPVLRTNQLHAIQYFDVWHTFAIRLASEQENFQSYEKGDEDENKLEIAMLEVNNLTGLFSLKLLRGILLYLFGRYEAALESLEEARAFERGVWGMVYEPYAIFFDTLCRARIFQTLDESGRKKALKKMEVGLTQFGARARRSPGMYRHKELLLMAEIERAKGRQGQAALLYGRSVELAREGAFTLEEGLANECAAEFYESLQHNRLWGFNLAEAYLAYRRLGCDGKAALLARAYRSQIYEGEEPAIELLGGEFSNLGLPLTGSGKGAMTPSLAAKPGAGNLDYNSVIKATRIIAGELKLENLLKKMMAIVVENAGAQRGFLILDRDGRREVGAEIDLSLSRVKVLEGKRLEEYINFSRAIVNYVARTGENVVLNNASSESKFYSDEYITKSHPRSILCTPVLHQGKLRAVIYLENNLVTGAFTGERLEIVEFLAAQASVSLENALLYLGLEEKVRKRTSTIERQKQILETRKNELEKEILLAQKIQETLLPRELPETKEANISYKFAPMMSVGGDFIDIYYNKRKNQIGFFICDVSGHGVSAAFISSMVKMSLQHWRLTLTDPAATMSHIQESLRGKMANHFLSACVGYFDLDDGKGVISNAGHPPAMIHKRSGKVVPLNNRGGILNDASFWKPKFEEEEFQLDPGDKIILYTDGITEAKNPQGDMLGEDIFMEIIRRYGEKSPKDFCHFTYGDVLDFNGSQEHLEDDFTLLVLQFDGAVAPEEEQPAKPEGSALR